MKPPSFLGQLGQEKWKELSRKLKGNDFPYETLALLCQSWETYLTAVSDIASNGTVERSEANGRLFANPNVGIAKVERDSIIELSEKLGLWETAIKDDELELPE